MAAFRHSRTYAQIRHLAKLVLGRPTVPPPVKGVADATWYDAAYKAIPGYDAPFWHSHYYSIWTVIADRVRRDHLNRVVDIGCGPGQFANCLFALTGIQAYDGLDFSEHAVKMARSACPQGRFHVDDATKTNLCRDTPHDVVICMEVLEHVPEDTDVIRQFRTGTRAICTVPNFDYHSHVRFFTTAGQVEERYSRFFDGFDVFPLIGHHSPNHTYYVMDGIRNNTT